MAADRSRSRQEMGAGEPRTLIEEYLPTYDARDRHETTVAAAPEEAWAALRSFDLYRSPIVRWIFGLRSVPARLRGESSAPPPGKCFLDQALSIGWRILKEEPGRELVAGAVTQPWAAAVRFEGMSGPEFRRFQKPGYTKIAWNLAARPAGPRRTILSTETRVAATDPRARRKFRVYWFFLSPGIRLIRRIALSRVRRELERLPAAARSA